MAALRDTLRRWWLNQPLIAKFAAILVLCSAIFVPATYGALQLLLTPTFDQIEEKSVQDQAARTRHALELYRKKLVADVSDYAVWDDAWRYILDGNRRFEAMTLAPVAYANMGVDVQAYIANDGTVRWAKAVDRQRLTVLQAETRFFRAFFSRGRFFDAARARNVHSDVVRTGRGLFIVGSQHAVRSDTTGPSPGFVVMGTLLDARTLSDALQVRTSLELHASPTELAALARAPDNTTVTALDDRRVVRIGIADDAGRIVGIVKFAVPRSSSGTGQKAILLATSGMVVVMLLLIAVLSVSIRHVAVYRLLRLEQQVVRMHGGKFDLPADLLEGDDEISRLARQFDHFNNDLDAARQELSRTSYLQGKADSAAGMLHNVRNGLAPLRVVQDRWLRDEQQAYRTNMERAVAELDSADCPDSRRVALNEFLVSAAREIARGGPGRRAEMAEAKSSIDQIAAILSAYDFDTSGNRSREIFDPCTVIRDEARILRDARFSAIRLELPDAMPDVLGNRVQFAQVVGNVLTNAGEALLATAQPAPRITVSVEGGDDAVSIRITDNGDGISAEDIDRVFERGWSTRQEKSGGLGMHWSANAMRSMGGQLAIESAGRGQGATAVITLRPATTELAKVA